MEAPNSLFSAIWTVHSLDNPKQRAVWWLHRNFWRDTTSTSCPAPAVPQNQSPVASQAHPQLHTGWRWDRQRQNQVLSPHQRSKGTQEAATAWHHLQAHSLILASQKNQLHIPLLNSLCHYSLCMVLPDEIIAHEQLSALFTQPCTPNNQPFVIEVPLTVRKKYYKVPHIQKYFQNFDSVFWCAQKSMNLTKKIHSLISSSSQDITGISLLQK